MWISQVLLLASLVRWITELNVQWSIFMSPEGTWSYPWIVWSYIYIYKYHISYIYLYLYACFSHWTLIISNLCMYSIICDSLELYFPIWWFFLIGVTSVFSWIPLGSLFLLKSRKNYVPAYVAYPWNMCFPCVFHVFSMCFPYRHKGRQADFWSEIAFFPAHDQFLYRLVQFFVAVITFWPSSHFPKKG